MHKIESLFLSQEDLVAAGCFDIELAIEVVEAVLVDYMNDKVLHPAKTVQVFEQLSQSRINMLPATLLDKKISGMKWVSVFPDNPSKHNKQNLSAIIILSEIETGFPIAIMDGTMTSNMRTAAIGAIAAKYLARQNSEIIGYIGAGENAKMNFMAMMKVLPNLKKCYVSSRTNLTERKFIQNMKNSFRNIEFIPCNSDLKKAVINSDVVVTATSTQSDLLKANWIKKGAFYCHVGGWEDEYQVALKADKIVCDDWEAVKDRGQTISRMFQDGMLKNEDIYANIGEIICNLKAARETEDEFIYFNTVGLAYTDIALAYEMYQRSKNRKEGQNLIWQKNRIFNK